VPITDDENLDLVSSRHEVDSLNSAFYGRFPYPWPPSTFPLIADRRLENTMLNQSLGSWRRDLIPPDAHIWIAGCGTNQAIYTALKFPEASIVASDISVASLEISQTTAAALGLSNITFRQESLNQVAYAEQFDYVVCTGVIHHTAEPEHGLRRISKALKRQGILELMVYNRYHRLLTTGVQKAVRILSRAAGREADFGAEFQIAKAVIGGGPLPPSVSDAFMKSPDAEFADAWLQPVEHSYTIESLGKLAADCNLRLLLPCLTLYDQRNSVMSWDVAFDAPDVQRLYDGLDDSSRWQMANLLLGGRSPMLWFYLCKAEMSRGASFEKMLCEQFLKVRFDRVRTSARHYLRGGDGRYTLNPIDTPFPRAGRWAKS
jgi:SAM-dependent methyltransferase